MAPGLPMFYTIAMAMFGAHVSSLVALYLIAVGISVVAFAWRFRDERLFVVVLYFLIMSVMLLTPLCWSEFNVNTAPIGGYRLCTLVAILPALHFISRSSSVDHARRQARNLRICWRSSSKVPCSSPLCLSEAARAIF